MNLLKKGNFSFNLKEANTNSATLIYLIYRSGSDRFKLSISEKIHPTFWNAKRQRAKANKAYPELVELNYLLDNIDSDIVKKSQYS
ncbi:MAG: hypothetical protein COA58_02035 [Bacteroidetes bacterium]|nr:MAG: hypothetical protein COA58_02035 [Bacteroidota bacterium]